jgi:hypothetical protein
MTPTEVGAQLAEVGFRILFLTMDEEAITFETAAAYVNEVEAYGYDMYMAPFSANVRPVVWDAVRTAFLTSEPKAYRHDQYMIYAIAQRR